MFNGCYSKETTQSVFSQATLAINLHSQALTVLTVSLFVCTPIRICLQDPIFNFVEISIRIVGDVEYKELPIYLSDDICPNPT